MFFLCILSCIFSIDGFEVDGEHVSSLYFFASYLVVRSWAALGASVAGLGLLLVPMSAVLGRSWDLCWRSWAALGPQQAVLGRSWGLCWRSWAALGA